MSGSNRRKASASLFSFEAMESRQLLSAGVPDGTLNPATDDSGSATVVPVDDSTGAADAGGVVVDHFGGLLPGGSIDDGNGGHIMYSFNAGTAHSHHAGHVAHAHHAAHMKALKHHH